MADVTEVIHKISYEVNDEALLRAQKVISLQLNEIIRLSNELTKYQNQLTKTSEKEVKVFEQLSKQVEKISKQLEREVAKTSGALSDSFSGILDGLNIPTSTKALFKQLTTDLVSILGVSRSASGAINGLGKSAIKISTSSFPLFFRSIAGIGGKLLGFSNILGIVINLLPLFGINLFGTKEKVEDLGEAIDETTEFSKKLGEEAASEISKMVGLKSQVEDVALSYDKRKKALDEIRRMYPDYFKDLSDEEILAGKVGAAYQRVAQGIIASAKARVLDKQMQGFLEQLITAENIIKDISDRNGITLDITVDDKTGLSVYELNDALKQQRENNILQPLKDKVANSTDNARTEQDPKIPVEEPKTYKKVVPSKDLTELEVQTMSYRRILQSIKELQEDILDNNKLINYPKSPDTFDYNAKSKKTVRKTQTIQPIEPRRLTQLTSNIDQPEITPYEIDVDAILAEHKKLSKELSGLDEEQIKKIKTALSAYQELASAAVDAYKLISKAQQEALDKEIEIREKRVADAKKLAERGNADVLRIEEQRLEEAQKKKEQIAQREQQVNSALALSNSLVAVTSAIATATKSGDPYTVALRVAAAVAAVIAALGAGQNFVRSFDTSTDSFADGVVGYKGKGGPRDDSNWVRISNGESVITAEATSKHRSLLEAINNGQAFTMAGNGLPFIMPAFQSPESVVSRGSISNSNMRSVERKLDNVVAAIEDNRLRQNIFFNEQGVGLMTERAIKKNNRRFK